MKALILLVFAALAGWGASAQTARRQAAFNLEKNQVAIQGYDPVAYFSGKPLPGKSAHTVVFDGVTYYFANPQNKAVFLASPARYEPQYGGWCAYAMGATGEKVSVDPENYKILDGKLYLFYKSFFNNTLKSWNKDEARLKQKADASWRNVFP